MQTLHEFYTLTKGHEYFIGVIFLILFPIFWTFLNKKKSKKSDIQNHE